MNTGVQGLLHVAKSQPIELLQKLLLAMEAFFLDVAKSASKNDFAK
jgi:hypothetical protein